MQAVEKVSLTRTHGISVEPYMQKLNIIAVIGLGLGSVFGLAGTMVPQPHLRSTFWAIDASGLVMACALLTIRFFRKGNDLVSAGFLVFAIGEGVILSGTAANLAESVPAFAAGTALWATALLLISIPREFAIWVRVSGVAASILFAITAMRIFLGEQLLPISKPLPFFGYPFLVITFVGWIWSLLKANV